ncbi:hypothetical protein V6N11_046275 [Hibiscus sabdariffa]|uniref:Uncharacterized protein n=1 Tax=Hibiscus sabdariffa TaxID=183260 RepID=A0ABR2AAG9_9ROSI
MLLLFPRVIRESLESTLTPLYLRHPLKYSWRIAATLMGRHIVSDVNYVAISNALDVSPYILATGLVEDNVICAVCFITLFALASRVPLRLQHHLKCCSQKGKTSCQNISYKT